MPQNRQGRPASGTGTPGEETARQDGAWTENEKARGAPSIGSDAGPAGEASPKAAPSDDRARTEATAAETERAAHAPDPDTPVGGGKGTRSLGGSATEPPAPRHRPAGPAGPGR